MILLVSGSPEMEDQVHSEFVQLEIQRSPAVQIERPKRALAIAHPTGAMRSDSVWKIHPPSQIANRDFRVGPEWAIAN